MSKSSFREIVVGDIVYPVRFRYRISRDKQYTCCIEDHDLNIVGFGESEKEAVEDFERVFHTEYSKLRSMRDFERIYEQQLMWDCLNKLVDSEKFEGEYPYHFRRLGKIHKEGKRYPVWIENVDGLKEEIPKDVLNYADFVRLEEGQWIEYIAVCRGGHKLNPDSISYFEKTTFNECHDEEWYSKLPVANLPHCEWKWP